MRKFFSSLIHVSNSVTSAPAHTVTELCLGVQNHAEFALCPWRTKGSMSEYEFADLAVIWGIAAALSTTGGSEAFLSVWYWILETSGDSAAQNSRHWGKNGFRTVGQHAP